MKKCAHPLTITKTGYKALYAPLKTSELYISKEKYRLIYMKLEAYHSRLNAAFPNWKLTPTSKLQTTPSGTYYQSFQLYIQDQFISESVGVASSQENVEHSALVRCCKDLCIAADLWDPVASKKLVKALHSSQ